VLKIEIPLNVSPKTLRDQFNDLLELHHPEFKNFNRWKASTAILPLENRKLTSASLNLCLTVYKAYLESQDQADNGLYEIGVALKLNPKLVINSKDQPNDIADKKLRMGGIVSEHLEKAKNLVAHATECIFPCVEDHHWVERKTRRITKNNSQSS
jgi:hypothetical protein